MKLDYAPSGGATAVTLDLWEPAAWARFRETQLGQVLWSSACTKATPVRSDGRRATIYAGYASDPGSPCPSRPPDRFLAEVRTGGFVVAANMPYCLTCTMGPPGPYNSRTGMEAVVRGLRLRG
ncbi:MAG: hypothetical protein ABR583_14950 [Gaiellaceae bacterium]